MGLVMEPEHAFTFVGGQQNDASGLECPADLIARRLIHLEIAFGFEALERGQ